MRTYDAGSYSWMAVALICLLVAPGISAAKQENPGQPFVKIDERLGEISETTEETSDDVGEILQFWAPGKQDWIYYATRGTARVDVDVDARDANDANRNPVLLNVLVQTQGQGESGLVIPGDFIFQNGVAPDMSIATVVSGASELLPTAPGLYQLELTPLGGNWSAGKYVGVLAVEFDENLVDAPPGETRGRALIVFEIPNVIND